MNPTTKITFSEEQLEGTKATFANWLVSIGDRVTAGQPIAELETDKVIMEVCSPIDGTVETLLVSVGEPVLAEQSLGTLTDSNQAAAPQPSTHSKQGNSSSSISNTASLTKIEPETAVKVATHSTKLAASLISPAVRRLLKTHNLDIQQLNGSGKDGRVTRDDVLRYVNSNQAAAIPLVAGKLVGQMVPHSSMRQSIATHMVDSLLKTSPHVTSIFEMDLSAIISHRKQHKEDYQRKDVKLTFTAYFLSAMARAVATVPQVNAKFHQQALEIFSDVNIGVGTALGDGGLVVPVVQQVQSKDLFQIATALTHQTEKARNGKLTTADVKNGTLTISNHGVSGSLIATPIIINQPQVAILGIGKLEKRVVVEEINGVDAMVIRPKCYVSLSIDHRALDAHQTNLYLTQFVDIIQNWSTE